MNITSFKTIPHINTPLTFTHKKSEGEESVSKNTYTNFDYENLGMYTSGIKKSDINEIIANKLNNIEKENNIKIIYACDAGSKAWGDDSKDSDYDIRYIYVSPKCNYSNPACKDFINNELNKTFDINGYDLSKITKLLKKDEYNPYELLNSPIKYKESTFSKELENVVNKSYSLDNMKYHYTNAAKSTYLSKIKNKDEINVKSYLITLKFLLSSDYIADRKELPPLDFKELFDGELKDNETIHNLSIKLLNDKKNNSKEITTKHIPILDNFIETKISEQRNNQQAYIPQEKNIANIDKFFKDTINSPAFKDMNIIRLDSIEQERLDKFPKDIEYKKELLTSLGYPTKDHLNIRSIVGPQEFNYILDKYKDNPEVYSTGNTIDEKSGKIIPINVINKTFRANLHIHTDKSDGEMDVKTLLDTSAKYANNVAAHFDKLGIKDYEPFTIAITDHNTTEGGKEALKIIYEDPDKYKNLRVVLGIELSSSEKNVINNKNLPIHILAQGINPFDENLNREINKNIDINHPYYKSLGNIKDVISFLDSQPDCVIGYAHPLSHLSQKLNTDEKEAIVTNIINTFRKELKTHNGYIENYYQSYEDNILQDKKAINNIKCFSDEHNLTSAGGLDTHGNSIFKA